VALASSAAIGAGVAGFLFRWQAAETEALRAAERAELRESLVALRQSIESAPLCRPQKPIVDPCHVSGTMLLDLEDYAQTGAYQMFDRGARLGVFEVERGNVDIVWRWTPARGALDLSGVTAGELRATLTTRPGARYRVHYALAGNPDPGSGRTPIKNLQWRFNGAVVDEQRFDASGRSPGSMGWVQRSFDVTAATTSSTLSVSTTNDSNSGPALDQVWWEELPPG